MVAVIAWVHRMSSQVLSGSSPFTEDDFVAHFSVGNDTFADEFRSKRNGKTDTDAKATSKKQARSSKPPPGAKMDTWELVVDDEDETVTQRMRLDQEAFTAYRNHYSFGWPLPPMEDNIVAFHREDNDNSFEQERLARSGFLPVGSNQQE